MSNYDLWREQMCQEGPPDPCPHDWQGHCPHCELEDLRKDVSVLQGHIEQILTEKLVTITCHLCSKFSCHGLDKEVAETFAGHLKYQHKEFLTQ